MQTFKDRKEAGEMLGRKLAEENHYRNPIVLALPRGGVPVAAEVARALEAPLDVFLVRKLGVPGHEELAMGAIASGGVRVLNKDVVSGLNVGPETIDRIAAREAHELERRDRLYRGDRPTPALENRDVILVDDGLATGASMKAAVEAVRETRPNSVTVAVPVAPPEVCEEISERAGNAVCLSTPTGFGGVGRWYQDFAQTTDDEVRKTLQSEWETR